MVLVDVDITQGDNDGFAYRLGYSINATGFTTTASYLESGDPNTISVLTSQSRIISGTNNKTQKSDFRGYLLFKGITIPMGSTIDDATLNLIGQSSAGGDVRVYGRLTASPVTPTNTTGASIFTKPLGTAFGTTTFASGADAPVAIDMKSTIQELVNTFDYNNDNMMLIMKANSNTLPTTPVSTGVSNSIDVRPFEFGGAIPNLTINYTGVSTITVSTLQLELANAPTETFTVDAFVKALGDNGACDELKTIVSARSEQDDTFSPGISGSTGFGEGFGIRFTPKIDFKLKEVDWNSTKGGGIGGRYNGKLYLGSSVPTSGNISAVGLDLVKNADSYGGDSGAFSQFIVFWSTGSQKRTTGWDGKGTNDGVQLTAGVEYFMVFQENDINTGWTLSTTTIPSGNSSTDGSNALTEEFITVQSSNHWNSTGTFTLENIEITGEEFAFDMRVNAPNVQACFEVDAQLVPTIIIVDKEFTVDVILQPSFVDFIFTVDALVIRAEKFDIDAIVRYAQGTSTLGSIPDLIIRVLRENPPSLTGNEIVAEVVKITSDPAEGFSFRGKTSRIKNWLPRLELDNLIQEDGSSPDWWRTNWSLV